MTIVPLVFIAFLFTQPASREAESVPSITILDARATRTFSNVIMRAEYAERQLQASNFVESVVAYRLARDELSLLMQGSFIHPEEARPLLHQWHERSIEVLEDATVYAETVMRDLMDDARLTYVAGLEAHNLRRMNKGRGVYTHAYNQLQTLRTHYDSPEDLWTPAHPAELFSEYDAVRTHVITQWINAVAETPQQREICVRITAATSLDAHARILNDVASSSGDDVHLAWLSTLYAQRVFDEPYMFSYWYGLGNSYALRGDTATANSVWRSALDYFPQEEYAHYHFARTCDDSALMTERALAHLRWITLHSRDPMWRVRAHMAIARRLAQHDDISRAVYAAHYAAEEARTAREEIRDALYIAAVRLECDMHIRAGRPDEAIAWLRYSLRMYPDDTEIWRVLCSVYVSLVAAGRRDVSSYIEDGIRACDEALRIARDMPGINAMKAYLHLQNNALLAARTAALREIQITPDSVSALTTLGYTYLREGDVGAARAFFSKAIDIDPAAESAWEGYEQVREKD